MSIISNYPYTDLHSINLDYVIKLCRENMGLHLEISGNQLLLKTEAGNVISSVTIHYAEEAGHASTATSATSAASATNATNAQNATYATNAAHAVAADTATVAATANQANSATTATSATNADYATTAGTAATATRATSAATADYATSTGNVEHADKAFENVENVGVGLKFTTYDGTNKFIVVGHADSATTDFDNNIIGRTYVSQVVEGDNGQIIFKTPYNDVVATITPTSASAASDTYGNTIADYVKTISAPNDSNYVTVSHGTGTAETLTVNYSNQAWKDTNDNVIKNTYIKDLECVEDSNDGHYKLVAYNGDDPQAELFRTELKAYSAQVADEATHAVTADTATTAATADTANSAANVAFIIQCYSNHDGSYSLNDPDTLTVENVTDSNGNVISLSDITVSTPIIFKYHNDVSDPIFYYYPANEIYRPSPSSPIMINFSRCTVSSSGGNTELNTKSISMSVLNGNVTSSSTFVDTNIL